MDSKLATHDYYVAGNWLPPSAFLDVLRAAQCSN
jgi:hypothetical protein